MTADKTIFGTHSCTGRDDCEICHPENSNEALRSKLAEAEKLVATNSGKIDDALCQELARAREQLFQIQSSTGACEHVRLLHENEDLRSKLAETEYLLAEAVKGAPEVNAELAELRKDNAGLASMNGDLQIKLREAMDALQAVLDDPAKCYGPCNETRARVSAALEGKHDIT